MLAIKWVFSFLTIYFLVFVQLYAQNLNVERVEFNGAQFRFDYNLLDTLSGRVYTILLYSSHDNYAQPLTKVSGDVGLEVSPGRGKQIIWNASEEVKDIKGKISFEIRAKIYIPFIRLGNFDDYKRLKRGKEYNFTWQGGSNRNILNIELYKQNKLVHLFPNVANVGNYKMLLPKGLKPGKNYRFKISDSKNKDEVVYTHYFKIKRRTPLVVKTFSFFAVGGALFFLQEQEPPDNTIPNPPDPN